MPYLRLKRSGQEFTCLGSTDGDRYSLLYRTRLDLPSRAYVGMLLRCNDAGEPLTCTLSDVKLNAQDFGAFMQTDIGPVAQAGKVQVANGQWILQTFGYRLSTFDPTFRGLLVYKPHQGDFELDLKVSDFPGATLPGREVGLVCLEQLDFDHLGVAVLYGGSRCGYGLSLPPQASLKPYWDEGMHLAQAQLLLGPGPAKELCSVRVSCASWEQLVDSVSELANGIEAGLSREMHLDFSQPAPAARLTPEQLKTLDEARAQVLGVNSGAVLEASRRIDEILNASPTAPSAQCAAAMPGAILACQDLYGLFHERSRFLAGPLSHWLLARRLGAPQRPRDALGGAWVMMAAGYPRACDELVASLPQDVQGSEEAVALKMMITRDYRLIDPASVDGASPITQLAFVRAAEYCIRSDLLEAMGPEPALRNRSSALIPPAKVIGVGPNHLLTELGVTLACARDVSDLLGCTQLDEGRRLEAVQAMARELGLDEGGDLPTLARGVAWELANLRDSLKAIKVVPSLMKLYSLAMQQPGGPVVPGAVARWQCLPLHDFADEQRGLMLRKALQRYIFVGTCWCVPELANQFCADLAQGLQEQAPPLAQFFEALSQQALGRSDQAAPAIQKILASPTGRLPSVVCNTLWYLPTETVLGTKAGQKLHLPPGRGAWEWQMLAYTSDSLPHGWVNVYNYSQRCRSADAYDCWSATNIVRYEQNLAIQETLSQKMPYHAGLLSTLIGWARQFGDTTKAEQLCRRLIELTPEDPEPYSQLAFLLYHQGRRAQAVEVALEAMEKCRDNLLKYNMMGTLAIWLVQENRPAEALKWGREAAESYSETSLRGYAVALEANGRIDEARRVYRDCALRYGGAAKDYLDFLLDHGGTDAQVLQAVRDLATEHAKLLEKLSGRIAFSLQRARRIDLLEQAMQGPLAKVEPSQKLGHLLVCALYARDFPKALDYARKLEQLGPLQPLQVQYVHMAGRLSRDEQVQAKMMAQLRGLANNADVTWYCWYVASGVSARQILKQDPHPSPVPAYVNWMAGMEAELEGDLPGAAKYYRTASRIQKDTHGDYIPAVWADRLEKQIQSAATAPVTAPAAAGAPTPEQATSE